MFKYLLFILLALAVVLIVFYFVFKKQIDFTIVKITGKRRIQRNLYLECKANDYLILNDLYVLVGENKIKKVDTIIFGNKYIYIVKEVEEPGEIIVNLQDEKWRNIYKGKLKNINNPFKYNQKVIYRLTRVVEGLLEKDLKSIVVMNNNATFNAANNSNNEFIVNEKEVVKLINDIEKESNDDILDPYEIERYCQAFYEYGLKIEKSLKGKK